MESDCHGRRGAASQGKGGGAAKCGGKGGGVAAKKGKRGEGPPLGFLYGRKETTPHMTLT
jgi:hypothetical protein